MLSVLQFTEERNVEITHAIPLHVTVITTVKNTVPLAMQVWPVIAIPIQIHLNLFLLSLHVCNTSLNTRVSVATTKMLFTADLGSLMRIMYTSKVG